MAMAWRSRLGSASTYVPEAGVSVTPGATAFTRMPSRASSTAIVRVAATSAALAVP
jgi:hypothetical protein